LSRVRRSLVISASTRPPDLRLALAPAMLRPVRKGRVIAALCWQFGSGDPGLSRGRKRSILRWGTGAIGLPRIA
jgi:hypothetical protein